MAAKKSDKNKDKSEKTKEPSNQADENYQTPDFLPLHIHGQYIKDLSCENPNAPDSLRGGLGRPTLDVNFTMDAKNIEMPNAENNPDNLFEVSLRAEVTAKRSDITAFIIDLEYGVTVTVGKGIAEDQVHPLLLIEIPRYAFPFIRQIISSLTQDAGYMPLTLAPIDFKEFYVQRFGIPGKNGLTLPTYKQEKGAPKEEPKKEKGKKKKKA